MTTTTPTTMTSAKSSSTRPSERRRSATQCRRSSRTAAATASTMQLVADYGAADHEFVMQAKPTEREAPRRRDRDAEARGGDLQRQAPLADRAVLIPRCGRRSRRDRNDATERKTAALTDADLAKMEREALEALDPKDRLALIWQRQGIDIAREQLEIAKAGARIQTNAITAAQERSRIADEAHERARKATVRLRGPARCSPIRRSSCRWPVRRRLRSACACVAIASAKGPTASRSANSSTPPPPKRPSWRSAGAREACDVKSATSNACPTARGSRCSGRARRRPQPRRRIHPSQVGRDHESDAPEVDPTRRHARGSHREGLAHRRWRGRGRPDADRTTIEAR